MGAPAYERAADEYRRRWAAMQLTGPSVLQAAARKILAYKERYQRVEAQTGIPWFLIGCLHMREASCSFTRHLHNGDPLSARTRQVPAGRPATGSPPFTWEASALDALTMAPHSLDRYRGRWSLERFAYEAEKYNGWGYRSHGAASAYLWAQTSEYRGGKYVSDGVWSSTAKDTQPGVMGILKVLMDLDPSVRFSSDPAPAPVPQPPREPVPPAIPGAPKEPQVPVHGWLGRLILDLFKKVFRL